ncbi:MAG: hypothetical protein IT380_11205 [Myxococcales bacterium]|nr:hypothetical protein [Myxococcales bacterium]
MSRRLCLAVALSSMVLVSCGPENGLGGSLGAVFPLDISKVEIARNLEALQVTYFLNRGVFLDVVARVSVSLEGVELQPGVTIPLGGMTDGGIQRCTVTHAPGGEPVRTMPPVRRGDLVLRAGGEPGQLTKGDFSVLFESEGGDLGQGRTLYGGFSAEATDAGFGELP